MSTIVTERSTDVETPRPVRRIDGLLAPLVRYPWTGPALVLLAVLPTLVGRRTTFSLALALIQVLLVLALYLVMGLGGHFTLGQAAVFGLGAYVGVGLMHGWGWDGLAAIPVTMLLCAALGALMAVACFRVSHLYIAFVTLAFGLILQNLANSMVSLTQGGTGIFGYKLRLAGLNLLDGKNIYWLTLSACALLMWLVWSIEHSRAGRAIVALREAAPAAASAGVSARRYMVLVFAIQGAFAGLAGIMYIAVTRVVNPDVFSFSLAVETLVILVLGGLRSWPGAVAAACAIAYVRYGLSGTPFENRVLLLYAAIVVVVLVALPRGVGGSAGDLWRRVRRGR